MRVRFSSVRINTRVCNVRRCKKKIVIPVEIESNEFRKVNAAFDIRVFKTVRLKWKCALSEDCITKTLLYVAGYCLSYIYLYTIG